MPRAVVRVSLKGLMAHASFFSDRRSVVERHFQQDELDDDHEGSLCQEGFVVIRAEPVEHSVARYCQLPPKSCSMSCGHATHFNIDATSIIKGISRENPSLVFFLCIDAIWSA
jgi:hypothetical protein